MSLSPLDIVKQIQQVPTEYAQNFSSLLLNLLSSFKEIAAKNLEHIRQAAGNEEPLTAKPFRQVPFIPQALTPGKHEKVADIDHEEPPAPRVKGP